MFTKLYFGKLACLLNVTLPFFGSCFHWRSIKKKWVYILFIYICVSSVICLRGFSVLCILKTLTSLHHQKALVNFYCQAKICFSTQNMESFAMETTLDYSLTASVVCVVPWANGREKKRGIPSCLSWSAPQQQAYDSIRDALTLKCESWLWPPG